MSAIAGGSDAVMLDVRDVSASFDATVVLDHLSLHVDAGEVVALVGPSGSGKSTLLRVIAGLITPDQGTITVNGVDVTGLPTHRRSIGMVFQNEQLFPHLSVGGNVGFALKIAGMPSAQRIGKVNELLELVGLDGLAKRRIDNLSGGEAKRVALARSMAATPKVLLLDEPLTGLDRDLHDRLMIDVAAILDQTHTTAIWVTHDHGEAAAVANRIESLK